jgi:hypothetical protein
LTDHITTALTVAVLGFMAFRLVQGVRFSRSSRGRFVVSEVRRRLGWHHLWPVPFVFTVVITLAIALVQVPGLSWGWWSAIGGDGNPVFGSTTETRGTALEWLIPAVFVTLLIPALPLFANAEERMFREGAEDWSTRRRVLKTIQFGLIHAIIGIPIGVAIALSAGGAYFLGVYLRTFRRTNSRREATFESTTAHTAYNGVIISVVIVALILEAVGV